MKMYGLKLFAGLIGFLWLYLLLHKDSTVSHITVFLLAVGCALILTLTVFTGSWLLKRYRQRPS